MNRRGHEQILARSLMEGTLCHLYNVCDHFNQDVKGLGYGDSRRAVAKASVSEFRIYKKYSLRCNFPDDRYWVIANQDAERCTSIAVLCRTVTDIAGIVAMGAIFGVPAALAFVAVTTIRE